jgi:hypothetical protein
MTVLVLVAVLVTVLMPVLVAVPAKSYKNVYEFPIMIKLNPFGDVCSQQ